MRIEKLLNARPLADNRLVPGLRSSACLNCGTVLAGPFCSGCGQRDVPPYPGVRELVVDAFWELSGWDGRFASTVRALVRQPGMLTLEFLEGRRARYLSPLRLYLTASLVYFLLAAAAPNIALESGKLLIGSATAVTPAAPPRSRPERVANAASEAIKNSNTLTAADKAATLKDIDRAPAVMRPFLRKIVGDPAGFKRGVQEMMPRMLFGLLPVFAAIVALFFRGRKYPEHLYFAIHLHAFIFLALAVSKLTQFARLPLVDVAAGAITFVWIPIYATLSFRRVYGNSIAGTLAKEIVIGTIYALVSCMAFIGVIYWVSLYG